MQNDKNIIKSPQKKEPPLMSRFVLFSAALFFVILVTGSLVFVFSMRQIIRANKESELSQLLEIKRLRLETSVGNEISLALMIAESPLIRNFFADPQNPELRKIAFEELAAYRSAFAANSIFWINDWDRLFYFNDDAPYVLEPGLPENYWYNMTLYETETYNFNINYNPDLNVTNLWINVPVFDYNGKALGMMGTGIYLTTFIEMLYEEQTENVDIFFFNVMGEITGAVDIGLVADKVDITKELYRYINIDVVAKASALGQHETLLLNFPAGKMAICSIPLLEWYSVAIFFHSINDYNSVMTVFFILTLIVILLVLVIFNVFIARLLIPMRLSMEEAYAANRAKSAFLSTMSHEIRTPLNAILGITEIQLRRDSLEQSVREGLEKVFASGDMLLSIINDILDLSKIESGKLELILNPYEVANLISDTVQLNIMRIGSKAIEFDLTVDENMPTQLLGDELRIKQILNNLLSNAFKYTASGSVKMNVSADKINGKVVSKTDDEIMLVIVVSDTGQGMTKEQVDRLFDAYSRFNMEANRKTEGTGLGMSITRNLIYMMNGSITIESEPGKGSSLTIRLPQTVVSAEALGKERTDNLSNFRTSGLAHLRRAQIIYEPMPYGSVLIVDDVETNLFVAKGLLSPYNLKIETSDSGFSAIEKIRKGKVYDIIFMDHMMPIIDGIETTKTIRDMGYEQPIIALTANAVAGQADIFLGNGFDDFISKPIDVRHLNTMLNKFIRDKQSPEVIKQAREQAEGKRFPLPDAAKDTEIKRQFAEVFLQDAHRSIAVLDAFTAKGSSYSEEEIRTYVIYTHGMKSALANIGKVDLSAVALRLEMLGRDKNIEAMMSETPAFLSSLKTLAEEITPKEETDGEEPETEDNQYLTEMLLKIKTACGEYDETTIEDTLTELKKTTWSRQTKNLLNKINEQLLHSAFEEIADNIDKFINTAS